MIGLKIDKCLGGWQFVPYKRQREETMGSRKQAYDDYRDSGYSGEDTLASLSFLGYQLDFLLGRSNSYDESSRRYDDDERNYYSDDGL